MAKKEPKLPEKHEIVEEVKDVDLARHAEMSYLEYAMSVVKGRAIPSVEDGLKPVQRRILFAMLDLGLNAGSKHKKSARVVGDVIGKYHPHGDSSVYEAMVRTAQSFSLRYPLVDGQGNFGSRDGDSAAAMRYTECRLTPIAEALLSELKMGTVDFVPNYDNQNMEPRLLPARLPFILLNGSPGIGVGIATDVPSHNLREVVDAVVHVYKTQKSTFKEMLSEIERRRLPDASCPQPASPLVVKEYERVSGEILDIIRGPDFATGASIISQPEEIRKIYQEGRGSVRLRAKIRIENEGTKNWRVVVDELPYPTSCQKIMEEVDALFNPKPKDKGGKKVFSPEQLRLKALFSGLLDKYVDSSDKENAVRLVFEPKSHKQDPKELVDNLLAFTSLETNVSCNLVMVGRDRSPRQKNLFQIVQEWCDFRYDTVERRTRHEHQQASWRHMILSGRLSILDHIEEVVQILKTSDEPKEDLKTRFSLNDEQAEDVMEIRLRQLARLERVKIVDEIDRLAKEISRLQKLLDDSKAMRAQIVKELEADRKTFGDERRTLLEPSERSVKTQMAEKTAATDDPVTVAISERGWIRVKNGHAHSRDAFAFKSGDSVLSIWRAKMSDVIYMFDETGRCYNAPVWELPSAKGGEDVPATSLADFQSRYACSVVLGAQDELVLASSAGYGFLAKASDLSTRQRAGKAVLSVDKDAKLLLPAVLPPGSKPENLVFAALSSNARLLCYRLSEINRLAKGKGVALIGLDEGQTLLSVFAVDRPIIRIETEKRELSLDGTEIEKHLQSRSSSKKGRHLSVSEKVLRIARPDSVDEPPTV